MAPCLYMVSHGRIFGYMDATGRMGCSEAMSRGRLESTADVGAKCPDYSPAGNLSDGLIFLAMVLAGQPTGSGPNPTGSATTAPGSTGTMAGSSGMHATGL